MTDRAMRALESTKERTFVSLKKIIDQFNSEMEIKNPNWHEFNEIYDRYMESHRKAEWRLWGYIDCLIDNNPADTEFLWDYKMNCRKEFKEYRRAHMKF